MIRNEQRQDAYSSIGFTIVLLGSIDSSEAGYSQPVCSRKYTRLVCQSDELDGSALLNVQRTQ
jgi:hypothetical protein